MKTLLSGTRFERFADKLKRRLHSDALFEAIVAVRDTMRQQGEKPGREHWAINEDGRELLFRRVVEQWCIRTECEPYEFPYSLSFVIQVWVDWRKDSPYADRMTNGEGDVDD